MLVPKLPYAELASTGVYLIYFTLRVRIEMRSPKSVKKIHLSDVFALGNKAPALSLFHPMIYLSVRIHSR